MKLAIIGGGSTYTPELVDGIARRKGFLPFREIWLHDLDSRRLDILAAFSRRQLEVLGSSARVQATRELGPALEGADFVVSQIRVGGQAARQTDTELGLKHGLIGQETTGCGGFACALRHIPASIHIAREMEKRCPHAVLLNFTNPAGIVTQALLQATKIRTVGICNVPWVMAKDVADYYHVSLESVELEYFGLNHLSWATRIRVEGADKTREILARCREVHPERYDFSPDLIEAVGALPSPYLQYYYRAPEVLEKLQKAAKSRAQEVMEIESHLLERYSEPDLCEKPPELMKRGGIYYGEVAASAMKALAGSLPERHILNLPNGKVFPWLPEETVIEFPWKVSRGRVVPEPAPQVPDHLRTLMMQVKTYEVLTIRAALQGDKKSSYLALLVNPLVGSASKAEAMLEELLRVNKAYLPQFFSAV